MGVKPENSILDEEVEGIMELGILLQTNSAENCYDCGFAVCA